MTKPALISFALAQATTAACAIVTGLRYVHWKHSLQSDGPIEAKIYLGACVIFTASFVVRFVRRVYRKKPDYFAEEMEHRRILAKGVG